MKQAGRKEIPDVCIVGAGLVGGLMAFELARRGLKVVVLEAGPRYNLRDRTAYMQDIVSGRIGGHAYASNLPERDVLRFTGCGVEGDEPAAVLSRRDARHWGGPPGRQ